MSFACRGKLAELEVSLSFSGCPEMASDSLWQWRKVLGALICTELSPGLLVFPICKAHDFISSLKVSLLKPLPRIILKIHFGCLMAFLSQEPLGKLPKSPCWREGKKRKSRGQVLSSASVSRLPVKSAWTPKAKRPCLLLEFHILSTVNSKQHSFR